MGPRMLALALLCWSGAAVAEDLVVIDADKASALAVGAVIPDGKAIELPAGAKVLLVGGSGKTVSLTGPYSGTPSAGTPKGDGKLMVALASLVKGKSEETAYVGATRVAFRWRAPLVKTEADVLTLDAGGKDTQCVVDLDPKRAVVLLEPDTERARKVTVMSVETGAATELTWPAKTASMAWPAALPLEDGNTYLVDIPQVSLAQFTVKLLPKAAANSVERASQLVEAGCTEQARLMVELIRKTAQ